MNPYVTEALAYAHIAELHREAALRRRFATPRPATRPGVTLLHRLRTWTATHVVTPRSKTTPVCCAA
jgi:hypothetical protein